MGKPKQSGSGFSTAKPGVAPKQRLAKSSADQTAEEQRAVALINQGKLQEAEAICKELIETGTTNHNIYIALAAIKGMEGDIDRVIELSREALRYNPRSPAAHNNLGYGLREKGDIEGSISACRSAISLQPNYPEAHNNLGNAPKSRATSLLPLPPTTKH